MKCSVSFFPIHLAPTLVSLLRLAIGILRAAPYSHRHVSSRASNHPGPLDTCICLLYNSLSFVSLYLGSTCMCPLFYNMFRSAFAAYWLRR